MRVCALFLFTLLVGCTELIGSMSFLPLQSRAGNLNMAAVSIFAPYRSATTIFELPFATLLQERMSLDSVTPITVGDADGMTRLCSRAGRARAEQLDFVLMSRSPLQSEILRCETAGIAITADLIAMYDGDLPSFPDFNYVWIAYDESAVASKPAAQRTVEALRYRFNSLIEGTAYEPYFTARRE